MVCVHVSESSIKIQKRRLKNPSPVLIPRSQLILIFDFGGKIFGKNDDKKNMSMLPCMLKRISLRHFIFPSKKNKKKTFLIKSIYLIQIYNFKHFSPNSSNQFYIFYRDFSFYFSKIFVSFNAKRRRSQPILEILKVSVSQRSRNCFE